MVDAFLRRLSVSEFSAKQELGPPKHVRDVRGAMAGRGEKGLLIATILFTRDAQREASRPGAPPIKLIDGERLAGLLKEHPLGVRVTTETVEHIEIGGEFFDQF